MKPCLRLCPAIFALTVILAGVIHLPTILCQITQPYKVCSQLVQCGNTTLHYPFWGLGHPAYCGHSGFEITCKNNVPMLHYRSLSFRVLKIQTSQKMITIARDDLWSSYCPQYLYNTTYDLNLFNDNNFAQENVILYYGCDSSSQALLGSNHNFNCGTNNTKKNNYFLGTSIIGINNMLNNSLQCNTRITVPVIQSLADQLALTTAKVSDLRSAVRTGFNLQWTANNDECDQCVQSGGKCGSNFQQPTLFTCYCANGSFSLTCNNKNQDATEDVQRFRSQKTYRKWKLVISVSCGITGFIVMLFVILYRVMRSMLSTVSIPNPCLPYPKTNSRSRSCSNLKRSELRVSATLSSNPNEVKLEYTPWLIVGLGNPGNKYHGTRHNVGFEMIDRISKEERIVMNTIQSKALVGIGSIGEVPVLIAKPQGYMNFSGESVGPLAAYYQVPLRHILLVYDEMSLPNGVLRLQPRGGHGHHNGVKSVIEHLDGRREFPRFCIGIGDPPGTMDMKAFLLQKFSDIERKEIDKALEQGVDAVRSLVSHGFNDRITRFNLGQKYKYNKV
ncbi:hypothetical protein QVD17_10151 [Tagetes erecta]|uniref:non-specific serine/threonine protein kinase n=1 Tax=Tagetes erecta TaxID=13708 RepID=A0AAD8L7C2_TARER|nr:hypothetical protein QVD17_10151 [Tagetes erecta]